MIEMDRSSASSAWHPIHFLCAHSTLYHRLEVAGYRGVNGGERTCGVRAAAAGAGSLHGEAQRATGRSAHDRPQQPPLQLTYPVQATTTSSQTPIYCDITLSLLHGRQTQSQRPLGIHAGLLQPHLRGLQTPLHRGIHASTDNVQGTINHLNQASCKIVSASPDIAPPPSPSHSSPIPSWNFLRRRPH